MSYTALYRKFRPKTFDEVKGQDAIVTTLKNQIKNERTSHAYLFCGTRGTGKTSIAKIFARAVNCESPVDGSPCGECATCKSILEGSSMNVIEMDAASNNSVDNIRQIVDEVSYSPTEGKYKVYIIDEAHMLSPGAFNALLKTLEEPPSYVIFILATTEVQKLPITILSRCQRYDFRRISIDDLAARIKELTDIENVAVEEKAVRYIAKTADGSMRDALSLLDQCIAFYFNQELTYDKVLDVLGAVDTEVFSRMLRAILSEDVPTAMKILEEIIIQGRELGQFVTDMTWYLRNLLLLKTADGNEEIIDLSSENMARLKEEAKEVSSEIIMRYIRILSELSGQLRYATQKRIMVEVALIKLCKPVTEKDYSALSDRIRQLENKIEQGVTVSLSGGDFKSPTAQENTGGEELSPAAKAVLAKALPEDIREVVSKWGIVVANSEYRVYLTESYPSLEGEDTLAIIFTAPYSYERFKETERLESLRKNICEIVDMDLKISVKLEGEGGITKNTFPDARMAVDEQIDFPIEEIESPHGDENEDDYGFEEYDDVERNEEDE